MVICDLRWAEGGGSLPRSSIARGPLTTTSLRKWRRCPEPLLAWGPLGCHGTWRQPQAPAHIPGSNPTFEPEPCGQDMEMWVDSRALLHRCMGADMSLPRTGALTASPALTSALLRAGPDFTRCEMSPYSEDTPVGSVSGQQGRLCLTLVNIPLERGGQRIDTPCVMPPWGGCSSMTSIGASLENFHNKKITV